MKSVPHEAQIFVSNYRYFSLVTVMRHMSALTPRLWAPCDNKLVFTNLSIYLEGNTHIKSIKKRLLAPSCKKYFVHFSWWPDALCRTSRRPSPAVMRQFKFCISGLNLIWNTRLGFNLCESSWYFESQGVWKNLQPVRGTAARVTEAQSSNKYIWKRIHWSLKVIMDV